MFKVSAMDQIVHEVDRQQLDCITQSRGSNEKRRLKYRLDESPNMDNTRRAA